LALAAGVHSPRDARADRLISSVAKQNFLTQRIGLDKVFSVDLKNSQSTKSRFFTEMPLMTRTRLGSAIGFALLLFLCVAGANAQSFDANLDPFQEVPPHNTPGYGSADATLSGAILSIVVGTGSYTDLLAGATAVTLNDAAPGVNGPIIASLTLDTPGNTSGTFSGSATLTSAQITDLLAGNTYINIRDSVFPSGEIRGQVIATPEPSSVVLSALAGLSVLASGLRRRKLLAA
jgi:hypothetical protein